MRLAEPRLAPVAPADMTEEQQEILAPMLRGEGVGASAANVFATLVHYPKLMKRWTVFANHCLFKSSLPAREREIVILRTAWQAQSGYEWGQHLVIGADAGLSNEEMNALKGAPGRYPWSDADRALIEATDELDGDAFLTDPIWERVTAHFSQDQMFDLIFLVGQYRMLAGALNSLGVQLDDGLESF